MLIAVGGSELIVRAFFPQDPGVWHQRRDGLITLRPNSNTYLPGFRQWIRVNSFGMRDREHTQINTHHAFRILLLGDSFMEALQLSFEESFPHLLEKRLRSVTGNPPEIISAGISGWGTDDQLTYLTRDGLGLGPDLILLSMTLHNDISDNLEERFHTLAAGTLHERVQEPLSVPQYTLLRLRMYLASYSHLYQLVRRYFRQGQVGTRAEALNLHVSDLLRKQPGNQIRRGWKVTHALLEEMERRAHDAGARMAIILIPLALQVSEDRLTGFLAAHALSREEISVEQPQRMMVEWARKNGVEVIDLLPEFADWTKTHQRDLYLPRDGHWNQNGHQLAADVVAQGLVARGLVSSRRERNWIKSETSQQPRRLGQSAGALGVRTGPIQLHY